MVSTLGGGNSEAQSCRASTDHGNAFGGGGVLQWNFGLVAGAWVDQTGGDLHGEGLVETGLVTADAGVDFVGAALSGFFNKEGIGQERTCHRHHVGTAVRQYLFAHFRRVDAVGGDQWNLHGAHQLFGDPGERRTWHLGGNGRYACFVPADAGGDDGGAGRFNGFGQLDHFVEG